MLNREKKYPSIRDFPTSQVHEYKTWIEIDRTAFEHNIKSYKSLVAPALLAPVIKSNAYGHGIAPIAQLCNSNDNVDIICVVSLAEAIQLKTQGITKPLLVLSILDAPFQAIAHHNIAVVVYDIETVLMLNEVGKKNNLRIAVHIKIDTGLSRLGFLYTQALATIQKIHGLSHITIQGMFTHFANSENEDQSFTNLQIERFETLLEQVRQASISIPLIHSSCSAAITNNPKSHFSLARAGIGMYGLWPSKHSKNFTEKMLPHFYLKPILTWKTTIIQIKEITKGSFIGYDLTHQVQRATRIAILPVGYWDGYDRRLSNKGSVMINGQKAPIAGRIAMNLMMIDITDIQVSKDDEVILLGNYPGITAGDLADFCSTINYEIVTSINPLLPRIIV